MNLPISLKGEEEKIHIMINDMIEQGSKDDKNLHKTIRDVFRQCKEQVEGDSTIVLFFQ